MAASKQHSYTRVFDLWASKSQPFCRRPFLTSYQCHFYYYVVKINDQHIVKRLYDLSTSPKQKFDH
jgi:hypothetical protein